MKYYLLNPLTEPITTTRAYDDGSIKTIILNPEEIVEFEDEVTFNHMRDYAIEIILNKRNIVHFDHEREKVREEIVKNL